MEKGINGGKDTEKMIFVETHGRASLTHTQPRNLEPGIIYGHTDKTDTYSYYWS